MLNKLSFLKNLTPKQKRWAQIIGLSAFLLLLLIWLQGGFTRGKISPRSVSGAMEGEKRLKDVKASLVAAPKETADLIEAMGVVRSKNITAVAAKVTAAILEIRVREGDRVQKGQLLVTLDNRDLLAQAQSARSQVAAAQSRFNLAQVTYNRYKKLFGGGAVSRQDMDSAEATYLMNEAELKSAQEQARLAEVSLSYALITAPYAGIVVEKRAEAGDMATPGRTLLVIEDQHRLRLEAQVREDQVAALNLGSPVTVRRDALRKDFEGKVEEIVPAVDPGSHTFTVKAALPSGGNLRSGMFGRLYFSLGKKEIILLPQEAVVTVGQLETVYVEEKGRPQARLVRTGRKIGPEVEILSGLQAGDKVLIFR